MAIFIIDFDRTIVNGHTHNTLARFYKSYPGQAFDWSEEEKSEQWNLIKHVPAIFSAKHHWQSLIEMMLAQGHQVAIASFSSYGHIIPRYLTEVLGLSSELTNKVFVEAWLPDDPVRDNKNKHIENILHHFKFEENNKDFVILIDDSKMNTQAAAKEHYSIIPAHDKYGTPLSTGKHLDETFNKLNELAG